MENVISNAERRALGNGREDRVPLISDVYAALPAITGQTRTEYEGEMKGADPTLGLRELNPARPAIRKTIYDEIFHRRQRAG